MVPLNRLKASPRSARKVIRRFLIHVLPSGFHRIRHYGLFANPARAANLAKVRALLHAPPPPPVAATAESQTDAKPPIAWVRFPARGEPPKTREPWPLANTVLLPLDK